MLNRPAARIELLPEPLSALSALTVLLALAALARRRGEGRRASRMKRRP